MTDDLRRRSRKQRVVTKHSADLATHAAGVAGVAQQRAGFFHQRVQAVAETPRARFDDNDVLPGEPSPMRWITPKRPTTIVATGLATRWAFRSVKALAVDGIHVGLLHLPCLRPFPAVERALEGVETIIVVEDHSRFGGLASLLSMRSPSGSPR